MARREYSGCIAVPSFDFIKWCNIPTAESHECSQAFAAHAYSIHDWPCSPLPASVLTALPDPWLCLSFLRRCHIPQPPHPPHRAGPVPAADHHRTASLVLPQVNSPGPAGTRAPHLTSPPPWASLTGCQPGSGAELRVTNTSLL